MYDDEERERPSWREIDRRRDRSRHVRDERPQYQGKKSKAVIANYKHKLKEAFRTGKIAEMIDKLEGDTEEKKEKRENMRILSSSDDPEKFSKALMWYLDQNYEDMDADILKRALNMDRDEITLPVLKALKTRKNLKEILLRKDILEKLNLLSMTSRNLEVRYIAKELLKLSE